MHTCFKTTTGIQLQRLAHCWSFRHSSWVSQRVLGRGEPAAGFSFHRVPLTAGCRSMTPREEVAARLLGRNDSWGRGWGGEG